MNLRSLTEYYFLKTAPILLLLNLLVNDVLTDEQTIISFAIYFIYAQAVSGIRLIQLKLIKPKDFYKVFIPLWISKFHDELYFGKNK